MPVVLGALATIVLLAAGAVALASGGGDGSAVVVGSVDPAATSASTSKGAALVVDVGGAVLHPGVYHLDSGARVGDAITAAGGYGPRVDAGRAAAALNLAAPLTDGQQIQVPSRDDPIGPAGGSDRPGSTGGGSSAGTLVDLNRATEAELEGLPGIGPATAAKIIASRETTPFASIQQLRDRKLVGQKTFDALKALVTVR